MRLRTVRSKLRKSGLPIKYVQEVYEKMKSISDESITLGGCNNDLWIKTIEYIMRKYLKDIRVEVRTLKLHDVG